MLLPLRRYDFSLLSFDNWNALYSSWVICSPKIWTVFQCNIETLSSILLIWIFLFFNLLSSFFLLPSRNLFLNSSLLFHCFSKRWLSYNFSRTCTAKDCVKPVEDAYAIRYSNSNLNNLVLRTDNGTQYIAKSFMDIARLLNIPHEYIEKALLNSFCLSCSYALHMGIVNSLILLVSLLF